MPLPIPPPAPVTTTVWYSKRDMCGLLLMTGARHGGVPGGDAGAARVRRLARFVELARAVERFQLRPASRAPATRPARCATPSADSSAVSERATARPLVSACSCISVRLAVGPPSTSSVSTGGVDRGDGVLDLEGDRLQRGAGELRHARGEGQAADEPDRLVVPPRRGEAAEGGDEVDAAARRPRPARRAPRASCRAASPARSASRRSSGCCPRRRARPRRRRPRRSSGTGSSASPGRRGS